MLTSYLSARQSENYEAVLDKLLPDQVGGTLFFLIGAVVGFGIFSFFDMYLEPDKLPLLLSLRLGVCLIISSVIYLYVKNQRLKKYTIPIGTTIYFLLIILSWVMILSTDHPINYAIAYFIGIFLGTAVIMRYPPFAIMLPYPFVLMFIVYLYYAPLGDSIRPHLFSITWYLAITLIVAALAAIVLYRNSYEKCYSQVSLKIAIKRMMEMEQSENHRLQERVEDKTKALQKSNVDLRVAKEVALESLKKYESLYNDAVEGLFQYDPKQEVLKGNNALARLIGGENAGVFPMKAHILSFFSAEVHSRLLSTIKDTGVIRDFEAIMHEDDQEKRKWVSMNIIATKDIEGNNAAIEGSIIDISDRKLKELAQKEAHKANQVALENLRLSDQIKETFLATMSHELRTPMNGISGYIDLARSQNCDQNVEKNLAGIRRSADEMMVIIDRILDFTQLNAGEVALEIEQFDVKRLVEDLREKFRVHFKAKNIDLIMEIKPGTPNRAWGDSEKISLVLENLLSNALKFTQTGAVSLKVSAVVNGELKGDNLGRDVSTFLFSVKDSGRGISANDRVRIFDNFSQADGSYHREYGGLGLGLAICKQYAESMNGTLTLCSLVEGGSRFDYIIDLPSETVAEVKPPEAQQKSVDNYACKILVVEDNITNQMVLKGMLRKLGCTVDVADNGVKALEIMQTENFDLILMDCQMPIMDGFETTTRIRSGDVSQSNIPIIAVTANVNDGVKTRCLGCGMNDYVKKPINRAVISNILQRWLT